MKEAFEKIIERFEERRGIAIRDKYMSEYSDDRNYYQGVDYGYYKAIEIVNQVAEEYKHDIVGQLAEMYAVILDRYGVDITGKWETATQNTHAINQAYMRGRQDERDKFDKWREEYSNSEIPNISENLTSSDGWIPVSERLPETDGKYIVCTTKGSVYCTKYHSRGKIFVTDMNTHIEAWQPLPAPYKPKGEKE